MKIKAYASRAPSSRLEPWSYELTPPAPHEVVIKVLACGLCHSDLSMMKNAWGMTAYPLVPGHEVVGEVLELGDGVQHLKRGDRVGVGWQRSACLSCRDCLNGNENLCSQSGGTIVQHHGGFAEQVKVDGRFAFALPAGLDTDVTGPLLCGGLTVYSGLKHAGMTHGKEVGVIGIGGLGHLAVQFAAKLGNRVTVFTTSPEKAEFASRLGAHRAVLTHGGLPKELTESFDILLNTVNVGQDWNAYLSLLRADGVLSFVGVPPDPLNVPVFLLLGKRRRIMASPIGSRAEITEMLKLAQDFQIQPIIERFPMENINDALAKLEKNEIRYRAVLTQAG